jgi:hypothetical protein
MTTTTSTTSNRLRIFQDQSSLDNISVASPCHAEWSDMVGSDKVRFCASCQKNVFNLSGMKRDEALDLLRATEGRACVRFYRRADGTVLTEDCPVGVALLVKKAKRATLAAAAVSLGAIAAMLTFLGGSFTRKACERIDDVKTNIESVIETQPLMGEPPMPMPEPEPRMGLMVQEPRVPEMGKPAPEPMKPAPPRPKMGKVKMPEPKPVEVKGGLG